MQTSDFDTKNDIDALAMMELSWILMKTDAREIQPEAFYRMAEALRKVYALGTDHGRAGALHLQEREI